MRCIRLARRRRNRHCGGPSGPSRDDCRHGARVGKRILHVCSASSGPARKLPDVLGPQALLRLVNRLSSVETFENFTGFGLYDRRVVDLVKSFADPYPYFRGMIAEIGPSAQEAVLRPTRPQTRHYQEQLLHALRHRHVGNHQPFQGAASGSWHSPCIAGALLSVPGRFRLFRL